MISTTQRKGDVMYRCLCCGSIFDEREAKIVEEYMGECHGVPAYESFDACPYCFDTSLDLFNPDYEEDEFVESGEVDDE